MEGGNSEISNSEKEIGILGNLNVRSNIMNRGDSQSKSVMDSKPQNTDDGFDSGMLSDNNIIPENDACSDEIHSGFKNSGTTDQPSEQVVSQATSEALDSGIDIEVSDKSITSSISNFASTSSTIHENLEPDNRSETHTYTSLKALDAYEPWELYFLQDDDGNTQLHIAVIGGYYGFIDALLETIPTSDYLDIRNDYSQTCLHLAVILNEPRIVRQLVVSGAKTGILDRHGNTALHLACKSNLIECVRALLDTVLPTEINTSRKYSPNVDAPHKYIDNFNYDGLACVHLAGMNGNLHVLRELIASGGDINAREWKMGYTILHYAAEMGNTRLVQFVTQYKDVDLEEVTYSNLTAYQLSPPFPAILRMLSDKGALPLAPPSSQPDENTDSSDDEMEFMIKTLSLGGPPISVA